MATETDRHDRLRELVRGDATLTSALRAARRVLGEHVAWAIGAGAVRDLVWNDLHDLPPAPPRDVDVALFDVDDLSEQREAQLERALQLEHPLPWEVRNQAAVHTWYHLRTGRRIEPYASLEDAIASWPETATCVGLSLDAADTIHVIAPYGLADLFELTLRRNPRGVTQREFRARAATKRVVQRWPKVVIVDDAGE